MSNRVPLRQQNKLFDTAINKMKQGLCFFDADARLIVCNRRYAEMYGLTPDQTRPGTTLQEIVNRRYEVGSCPDLSAGEFLRWRNSIARSLKASDTTMRLKDGRTITIHHEPMADGGWVATHDDITDLVAAEERLRLAAEATGLGIWDADFLSGKRRWSKELYQIVGLPEDSEATRAAFDGRIHPDDVARVTGAFDAVLHGENGGIYSNEYRIIRANDGAERWISVRGKTFFGADGSATRMLGTVADVTEQHHAADELRATEERLRLALQVGRMVVWEHDLHTGLVHRSETAEMVYGLPSGTRAEFDARVHPEDRWKLAQLDCGGTLDTIEFRYAHPDGTQMWLGSRAAIQSNGRQIGVTFDITERKKAEGEVWRIAHYDWLTGLPNRRHFQTRFEHALALAKANGTAVTLLIIDLDDFKDVNDTLGHDAGDALLKETAERLHGHIRDADCLARLGGDEFAILLVEPLTLQTAAHLADEVLGDLRRPFAYNSRVVASRASIGMASFPDHQCTVPDLMKAADIALYRAKSLGRNRAVAYSADLQAAAELRVAVLGGVREALVNQQIVPFYQPKFDLVSGQIAGFEALARWQHPMKGLLTPRYFGAAFDDPELAEIIGKVMTAQVARDIRDWVGHGLDCGRVALNLSAAEFRNPTLAQAVLFVLEEFGVSASNFEVEVTESVLLAANAEHVTETLNTFNLAGVSLALDDFGTGFASLTHLKKFPVDHIKIDRSFVQGLETDEHDTAIVSAVVGLAKTLGMQVTAEGVETEEQANALRQMGCGFGQGYLWAKPMIGTRVPNFIRTWSGNTSSVNQIKRRA